MKHMNDPPITIRHFLTQQLTNPVPRISILAYLKRKLSFYEVHQ